MNAKNKYNLIIQEIEDEISNEEPRSAGKIAASVASCNGIALRDLNTVMVFLTERTTLDYVKYRKMMSAYLSLLHDNSIETAIEISGYDNQSSFTKQFGKVFGTSPKEAQKLHDFSLYQEALTWDCISGGEALTGKAETEITPVEEPTVFGIAAEQYEKMKKAMELQELYGFDQTYSQVAFEVAEKLEVSLEDAFEYMDSWRTFLEEDYKEEQEKYMSFRLYTFSARLDNISDFGELLKDRYAFHENVQYLYFYCGLSVTLALMTLERTAHKSAVIKDMDPLYVYEYAHTADIDFEYYIQACKYYDDNKDDMYEDENFHEYVNQLSIGRPMEEAFLDLLPCGIFDDITITQADLDAEMEDLDSYGWEAYEEEIMEWNNREERFDDDYDPDNPCYNWKDDYN